MSPDDRQAIASQPLTKSAYNSAQSGLNERSISTAGSLLQKGSLIGNCEHFYKNYHLGQIQSDEKLRIQLSRQPDMRDGFSHSSVGTRKSKPTPSSG